MIEKNCFCLGGKESKQTKFKKKQKHPKLSIIFTALGNLFMVIEQPENKSIFLNSPKRYFVEHCTQWNCLIELLPMSTNKMFSWKNKRTRNLDITLLWGNICEEPVDREINVASLVIWIPEKNIFAKKYCTVFHVFYFYWLNWFKLILNSIRTTGYMTCSWHNF